MQLDQPERGFSFMREGPLDMRMDPNNPINAADIVNTWSEQELGRIFREYGEEKQWRAAARVIVNAREEQSIETTHELANILKPIFFWKKKGINPLTLIFQALRICVNRELEVVEKIIPEAISCLSSGGRLAIISFHSLEDRIVKNAFRYAASDKEDTFGIGGVFINKTPLVKMVTRKPIEASDQEVARNPRSRSAKLRVIEKI
jgi:16S rRNA (cytosine1402-N4)-methyltransferase